MNDYDIKSSNQILESFFENINSAELEKSNNVVNAWKKTVLKIKPNGEKLASHSKVIDLKNDVLLVETDHPGWSQMLQLHRGFILKGLNMIVPELKIKTIAFRLKGNDIKLFSQEEEIQKEKEILRKKIEQQEEKTEKALSEMGIRNKNSGQNERKNEEMPESMKKLFEDLKNSMLTNSKN